MLRLVRLADDSEDIVSIKKVVIEASEDGFIDSYVEAFGAFLISCGFQPETVYRVLPTLEK